MNSKELCERVLSAADVKVNGDRPNVDRAAAFITVCGRVLGLTPDHSSFRPHVDRSGRSTVTWNSFVKGMSGQSVESDYTSRFGAMPDWTTECHLHHQHLLRLASIQWGQPLPKSRPESIVPAQGSEFDYRIPGPPREHSPLWPGTASQAEMLAQLAASVEFERRLQQEFGIDRAGAMGVKRSWVQIPPARLLTSKPKAKAPSASSPREPRARAVARACHEVLVEHPDRLRVDGSRTEFGRCLPDRGTRRPRRASYSAP